MMSMAHQIYKDQEWGFAEYVKNFFIMTGTWISSVGDVSAEAGKTREKKRKILKISQQLCG